MTTAPDEHELIIFECIQYQSNLIASGVGGSMWNSLKQMRNRVLVHIAAHSPLYYYRKAKHEKTFLLNGERIPYVFTGESYRGPRCIEYPIGLKYLEMFRGKKVLEVGNTMRMHFNMKHDTIDKYDSRKGAMPIDLFDYDQKRKYDLILSISTLEHVGWDEHPRVHGLFIPAIRKLKSHLKKGGLLVFTIPLGYNKDIDKLFENRKLNFERYYLKKANSLNEWVQNSEKEALRTPYGGPGIWLDMILLGIIRA